LKYCPALPERFGCIADARAFCAEFFEYYNHHHRHSGIALHTPASMHFGTAELVQAQRAETLTAAYTANPRRFCHLTAGNRHPKCPPSPGSTSPASPTTHRRKVDHWSQTA
jgi:putative transposase